jgi:imidazolonepropionase-like amidohydrolase
MARVIRLILVGLGAVAFVSSARPQQPNTMVTAISDVTVVPVTGAAVRREHVTVIIRGEQISAMGPVGEVPIPAEAHRIDGRGKFLLPGFIDLHMHLSKARASAMRLLIAHGITTVRDMGGDHEELLSWREVQNGSRVGPRIVMAGPYLESVRNIERMRKDPPEARVEPFEQTRIGVGSPDDARRIVASVAARGVDFIKIRTVANEETYLALNAAADAHGIALVGHVTGIAPQVILKSGQDGIDHFIYPSVDDAAERVALWKQFAARSVPIVPTIGVLMASAFVPVDQLRRIVDDDSGRTEPLRPYVSKYMLLDWREQVLEASDERRTEMQRLWESVVRRDLREMHAAGMDVLVGSDTAVLNVYPGDAVHREMQYFVTELGMTPADAIERATRRSAQLLRLGDTIGTVERGKVADLVLLDADPLVDIRHTRQIDAVVVRGRVHDRAALDLLRREVLAAPDVREDDWGRTRKR